MDDQNIILSTGGLAIGTVYLIERLKASKYVPFLTADSATLNRWVGILAAGVAAGGIHYEWDPQARILGFAIPTAAAAAHGVWQWFLQWALQQYFFKTGVTKG